MINKLINRAIHQNLLATLLFCILIFAMHFVAGYLKSLPLFMLGMVLYPVVSLVFVKKNYWHQIKIKKPINCSSALFAIFISGVLAIVSFICLYFWVGLNSSNFTYIMAKQQMSYGVITPDNAWKYFPFAAIGYFLFHYLCYL